MGKLSHKTFVSCWQKQKLEFGKGKAIKKDIFNRISSEFNSIFTDVKVIGEHCSRKWLKLEEEENGPQENMEIFHEMESCIGGNPNVPPNFTLESSSSTTEVLADDDSEEGGEDEDQPFTAESSSTTKGKTSESGCK